VAWVVEALDVPEDPEPGLLAGSEALAGQKLLAQAGEEGLGEGVVPGVADRVHREVDARLLGVGAVDQACVLRPWSECATTLAASPPRAVTAIPSASSTKSALRSSRIDQPMIRQLKTSWTAARERKPWPVWMYLRSQTQNPVWLRPCELTVDEVRCGAALRVSHGRAHSAATAVGAADPELTHQASDALLSDTDAVAELQLRVDPRRTIDLVGLGVDLADPLAQHAIGELARARRTPLPGVVALTRHTDDPAQQGDGELCGLSLDEPEPRHGRSVSLAKKTAARFRISRS